MVVREHLYMALHTLYAYVFLASSSSSPFRAYAHNRRDEVVE